MEKIPSEDNENVKSELASLADWIKKQHPNMSFKEINRYLLEMLGLSV